MHIYGKQTLTKQWVVIKAEEMGEEGVRQCTISSVFAYDVMKSTSLIRWCNYIFCFYLCGYNVIMPCVQQLSSSKYVFLQVCVLCVLFASCQCLSGENVSSHCSGLEEAEQ